MLNVGNTVKSIIKRAWLGWWSKKGTPWAVKTAKTIGLGLKIHNLYQFYFPCSSTKIREVARFKEIIFIIYI